MCFIARPNSVFNNARGQKTGSIIKSEISRGHCCKLLKVGYFVLIILFYRFFFFDSVLTDYFNWA